MSTVRPDELVLQIVRDLETEHEFVLRVPARPLQGVIDVKWAIKTAAQVLGRPVEAFERRADGHVILVASLT
ncbi:hypothetical protein [Nocardioides pocheonensis]|uniref:Uncharacterized protein n=1 Tax=Nocardioides pocheonensis TaxID=661485 RepID=A0A3N0GNR1_9ACTN|nr:hypothetical protein [Nocardioides pocheonensis]RNM14021.1 hypothetical protein EFL26_13870 [Nocardioides pocheonensis]